MEARDLAALHLIARFRMVTRPQLRRVQFGGLSETVAKRSIDRLLAAGYLGAARVSKTGYQVLWCTSHGRDHLVEQGASAADLFPARGPAAAKDFRHTERIVDVAIALLGRGWRDTDLLPAWALQRTFGRQLRAVPDLLALTHGTPHQRPLALAIEVDLGGESLPVLVAKTSALCAWLRNHAHESVVAALLLTEGSRRRASLAAALASAPLGLPLAVGLLESFTTPAEKTCASSSHVGGDAGGERS